MDKELLQKEKVTSKINKPLNSICKEDISNVGVFMKEKFDIFSIWISGLSWGKFILFIILTSFISNILQDILTNGDDNNWIHKLTGLFILLSFGVKILINSKVRAEERVSLAEDLAEKEALKRQLIEAKIQVMQAQIEPHFLFNTLSSLQYLIESDTDKAKIMLTSLINYLRYALPQIRENQAISTVGKEMDNIKSYLDIMQIRMGERLVYEINIPDLIRQLNFPAMVLQPVVENAIKYGIEESITGGKITLSGEHKDGCLIISVVDTGLGFQNKKSGGNGMALNNIRERLKMLYANEAHLLISENQPHGVIVQIKIPNK